jgi:hypothetical protein
MLKPIVALFGKKQGEEYDDFIAERDTRAELVPVEKIARERGFISFRYVYDDGTPPDFIGTITIK